MKKMVRVTYQFDRRPEGNGPDEEALRREIVEAANLIGVGAGGEGSEDQKAYIAVLLQNEFTAEQYARFRSMIDASIAARRARLNMIKSRRRADGSIVADGDEKPGEFVFEPTIAQKRVAQETLRQVDQIEARWRDADAEAVRMMSNAAEIVVTGLEPTRAERAEHLA